MIKTTRPLKSPFWNIKVQIHFLPEKTKTEVNQLTRAHEAIWPLAQEDTIETSGDLTPQDTEISQPEDSTWVQQCIFKIEKKKKPKPRNG